MRLGLDQMCPACGALRSEPARGCRYHDCWYDERVTVGGKRVTLMGEIPGCNCDFCKGRTVLWSLQGDWYADGKLLTLRKTAAGACEHCYGGGLDALAGDGGTYPDGLGH